MPFELNEGEYWFDVRSQQLTAKVKSLEENVAFLSRLLAQLPHTGRMPPGIWALITVVTLGSVYTSLPLSTIMLVLTTLLWFGINVLVWYAGSMVYYLALRVWCAHQRRQIQSGKYGMAVRRDSPNGKALTEAILERGAPPDDDFYCDPNKQGEIVVAYIQQTAPYDPNTTEGAQAIQQHATRAAHDLYELYGPHPPAPAETP